jgi:catechol 2,3-dioxygenase-like lactoylglutathione lyase family enzyme
MKKMLVFILAICSCSAIAQDIKLKYIALNVPDKMAAAEWYHNTLGFTIIKENNKIYVSDAGGHFRINFFSDPSQKNSYSDVSYDACHIALECSDLAFWEQTILSAGGKYNTPPRHNLIGDAVIDVRDPNGIMIQLVHRLHPFYSYTPGKLRFEHLALNMTGQKDAALWYVEFMGLTIPWSKDPADSTRAVSTYRIPYVGDPGNNMSMEFLSTGAERDYTKLGFNVSYIVFEVKDARALAKRMAYGGAKQVGEAEKDSAGNLTIRLRCPWGNMLELYQAK